MRWNRPPLWAQLIGLWAGLIFFGPLGWSHYLIGPLLLLPALFFRHMARTGVVALLLVSHPMNWVLAYLGVSVAVFIEVGILALLLLISAPFVRARLQE
jgi:hypothetical protein